MANAAVVQPIDASQETQFAELCRDTSFGFRDSVDLVLIHNEEDVRGIQPRAVLNDLTVLLAVAAWERFVVDVQALGVRQWSAAGLHRKADGIAYLVRQPPMGV